MAEEEYSLASKQELIGYQQLSGSGYQQLNGYSNKLLDKLCMQWENVLFCDMFIVTSNKHLPVHACVMSAFSSRVLAHISNSSSTIVGTKLSPPYIMKVKFSYEVIDAIVRALYTGVFCPPTSILAEIYAAVEWLDIFELSELLKKYYGSSLGHASEGEVMNWAVNTDTNIETLKPPDNVADYENSNSEDPACVITQDNTSIKQKSPILIDALLESKTHSVEVGRNKARKQKSIPHRYNKKESFLEKHKKLWLPDKVCGNASLHTSPESHPNNDADLHNHSGQTLLPDSGEVEKADIEKTTSKATDAIKTPQGVGLPKKRQILSSKHTKKKSEGKEKVKAEVRVGLPKKRRILSSKCKKKKSEGKKIMKSKVSDTDPLKSESDNLIADIEIIKCKKCYIKFSSMDMYVAHINDHPVFNCSDCGEVFYRKFNYTKHQRDKHLGRPYLKCRLCGHQSQNEVECRSHSDEVHCERKPFLCPKEGCGFKARKYECLNIHLKIHSDEKEYYCEKCGQKFSQYASVLSHRKTCYSLGSFLCDLCGQSFNHQQSMKIHRRTMHLLEKPYLCSVCSKQFSNQSNLKRHMRIHNNSFPYTCLICKKSFRHSNTLKGHMSSRHKETGSFHMSSRHKETGSFHMSSRHKETGSFHSMLNSEALSWLGAFNYK